eukprot:TRINITY_DN3944_c0_g1_i3.p1 TRINITY_DN3944_c0_g1~~TRINITY_DN3944_c0_g1_i3.p1  ORF type:complete len:516 (+),score=200.59 TRINITY_DN3944_c0_g1_i3:78-1625(+)
MPAVVERPGEEHSLRDLLERWGVTESLWRGMSPKWRCTLAADVNGAKQLFDSLNQQKPSMVEEKYVAEVHAAAGSDGLTSLLKGDRAMNKPKLAFNSSWGKPGADLINETHLTVVHKLNEVFEHEDPTPRNLQMFHRATQDEPNIPVLPSLISWPEWLEPTTVPLDKATRFSQKDALTTWHLDDCGEIVFQTALPKPVETCVNPLIGPGGKPVVKIFFCVEKWAYDYITQDQEQNRSARFSMMDLWEASCEQLPDELPLLTLCLIEAGGRPLMLYPNLMHTVLTTQDSVLVEERRLSLLFLEEVAYFNIRSRQSTNPPIFYDFVKDTCTDAKGCYQGVVVPLLHEIERIQKGDVDPALPKAALLARIASSLACLAEFDEVFTLDDSVAASLTDTLAALVKSAACGASPDAIHEENKRIVAFIGSSPYGVLRDFKSGAFYAYTHAGGAAVFGPKRATQTEAMADRRVLAKELEFTDKENHAAIHTVLSTLAPAAPAAGKAPAEKTQADQALLDDLF